MADEDQFFTTFGRYDEFSGIQAKLLSKDLWVDPVGEEYEEERVMLTKLIRTLDEYQEQAYLLDPYLEQLVEPVVERLKYHARTLVADPSRKVSQTRFHFLTALLYHYIKFRGSKTIARYFPHEVDDLAVALSYIRLPNAEIRSGSQWDLRYIVLLWLALICKIPFNLSQFDEPDSLGQTADALEALGREYLDRAGLEREGAALLLSRLYVRKDTGSRLSAFISWASEHVANQGESEVLRVIGILQVFSEVLQSAPLDLIKDEIPKILALVTSMDKMKSFSGNTLIRKFKTKIISRVGLRILPPNPNAGRRRVKTLTGDELELQMSNLQESEVPEEIEVILEALLQGLEDKDTIVRYSTAKGLARIAEHLPTDFSSQIVESVLALFSVHSMAAAAMYDLPAIAEHTWHGACLACAELARRNQVSDSNMPELVEWLSKALYFDIRKGAHSIGSNVRDAAAYVLWALARTQDSATLKPHATNLANRLASVAIYDREIHIRRAASAAYQEHVGRMNLFPHGIDVLAKTDFYSVSVRRNAFLVAAPEVAQHPEYRDFLLDHVLNVVLRHWDVSIRELGSQSLKNLCLIDLDSMATKALQTVIPLLESIDTADVHGGLLALSELGLAYQEGVADPVARSQRLRNVFRNLSRVSYDIVKAPRNHLVTAAACRLIAATLTIEEIEAGNASSVPDWRKIVDVGIKHRVDEVQDEAAAAMGTWSRLADCSFEIERLLGESKSGGPILQKSVAKIVGALDFEKNKSMFSKSVSFLLDGIKPSQRGTIEARRASYVSIPLAISNVFPRFLDLIPSSTMNQLINAMVNGLDDYSIDERGDIGSWVRLVSIQGLTTLVQLLFDHAGELPDFEERLPPSLYVSIVGGILKQGVERLDNVRQEAGKCFLKLLELKPPGVNGNERWEPPAKGILRKLFQEDSEHHDWADGAWLFPRAVKLLAVPTYRKDLLTGILLSIGSKTDSTQRPVSKALIEYMETLPVSSETDEYTVVAFVDDLLHRVTSNLTSNAIVIPLFHTFNFLFEAGVLERLADDDAGYERLEKLRVCATKNVARWKNIERINEAMKIVVALLAFERVRRSNIDSIHCFLAHPFPKIRYGTAEYLYLQVESADYGVDDTSDIESILLETTWATITEGEAKEASDRVVELFSADS
ncbi:hypothetical protein D9611_009412 [Ephemerocybe angulata]|uniref:Tubulin-specific chaperone D n=1 Tax=Ephemerocybe angulata TaxID=980116 RepID=A0A8H5AV84_9AGAR|nr:hypothetical protein D9611_009412 [Tulosesus angulatus]